MKENRTHSQSAAPTNPPDEIEAFIASVAPKKIDGKQAGERPHLSARAITEELQSLERRAPARPFPASAASIESASAPQTVSAPVPQTDAPYPDLPQHSPAHIKRAVAVEDSIVLPEPPLSPTEIARHAIEKEAVGAEGTPEDVLLQTDASAPADASLSPKDWNQNEMEYAPFAAPYLHSPVDTQSLMIDLTIALLPALCWSISAFGWRALTVTLLSVVCCGVLSMCASLLTGRAIAIGNGIAVTDGILLAFCLPAGIPFWIVPIGAVFVVVLREGLFVSHKRTLFSPVPTAALLLFLLFRSAMTAYLFYGETADAFALSVEASVLSASPTDMQLFLGIGNGTIGSVSALMLLLGGIYLFCRRVIDRRIPTVFLAVMCFLSYLFPTGSDPLACMLSPLLQGCVLLPVFFMAAHPSAPPLTSRGRILYALVGGTLAWAFRYFPFPGLGEQSTLLAVTLLGPLTRLLDRFTRPAPFGAYSRLVSKKQKQHPSIFSEEDNESITL